MATPSEDTGADLLEFCLQSWTAFDASNVTDVDLHSATAGKVAALLISAERFQILERLLYSIPDRVLTVFLQNEQFRRALIELRRHQHRHDEVCQLIKNGTFSKGWDLVEVWDCAHYGLWEQQYKKPLSALIRFRIRKRNPPPPSICKDGRRTRSLDSRAKAVLVAWLKDHHDHPYPNLADRQRLSQKSGLTPTQVKTWFANARRRRQQKEGKPEKGRTGKSAQRKVGRQGVRKTSSSAISSPSGITETQATLDSPRQAKHVRSSVPPVGSTEYLQLSPGPPTYVEGTGLQGLMCMYHKLVSPESPAPFSFSLPSSNTPLYHHQRPVSSDTPVYSHQRPSCSRTTYTPHHSRQSPPHCRSALHHQHPGSLVQAQEAGDCGELRGRLNQECKIRSPVLVLSPRERQETSQTWSTRRSPSVTWPKLEAGVVRNPTFSGHFLAMPSPPQHAASAPRTLARKCAVKAETLTIQTSSDLSHGTADTSAARPSALQSERTVTDQRALSVSGEYTALPQSPVLLEVDVPDGNGVFIRDQCLAMWNTPSWFSARSPQMFSPYIPDTEAVGSSGSDWQQSDTCHNHSQTDTMTFASFTSLSGGELPVDSLLQPVPKTMTIPVQTSLVMQNSFSPRSTVAGSADDMDEAAHILLDLATTATKSCLP